MSTQKDIFNKQHSLVVESDFVRDSNLLAMAEMIKNGITCFADMCFPQEVLLETVRNVGLRCQISFMVSDNPTPFAQTAEAHLHKGLNLYDRIGEYPLLRVACAPQDLHCMSDTALDLLSTYTNELDLSLHIPCHQSADEIIQSNAKNGCRPLNRLNNIGLLSPQTQLVHMNLINEADIELLKQSNAHVLHCPSSSLEIEKKFFPIGELQQASINTALGTGDITSANGLDLFDEMRIYSLMASADESSHLNRAHSALRAATINAARALGWDHDIGSIEAEKYADIIALEIDPIAQQPLYNPLSQLVSSHSSMQVSHSWVAGRPLLANRQLVSLKENKLSQSASDWYAKLV